MNSFRWFIGCLYLALTVAFGQPEGLIYDQLTRPDNAVYYHVPIGLCEDYPEETTTMKIIRSDMELLRRAGINLLRISFGWDGIEVSKDTYDWGFWDDYVKIAVDEYGITLIPYICYTPMWNSTGDMYDYWNHTPTDYYEFGEFVGDIVNRYKDRIKSWELWNEPDITAFWSGNVEEYARLAKIGSRAVRETDPEAIVVLGGLAHQTDFTKALFRDYEISFYVDVVNIHNYFETWHPSPMERIEGHINEIYDIVDRWGDGQAVWMAEVGYSTWRMGKSKVSNDYYAYYDYEHTPAYQAVDLFRRLTMIVSTGKIDAVAWYEIKDLPPIEEVIGDNNNRNLGVAYVDHTPKPAEEALVFFNELFSQPYRTLDGVVVTPPVDSESVIKVFENQDGSCIVVGWLPTVVAEKGEGELSGSVKDTRRESVEVLIPQDLRGKATSYDHLGNGQPYTKLEPTKGKVTLPDLLLRGGEVTIIAIEP